MSVLSRIIAIAVIAGAFLHLPSRAVAATYDVNDLTIAATSGDTVQTVSNVNGTGGNFIRYKANAASDYITFDVSVPTTQTYQVTVRYQKWQTHGICQLAIDGVNQGSAQDLYNSTTAYPEIDLGTVSLAAGTRAFKFTATGKNASSSDYHLGLDLITLTPIGPSIYDVNDLTIAASSGDTVQTVSNVNGTGGNFIRYKANAANDYVTFDVSVPATQTYQVTVRYQKWQTHGICQLAIDGVNQGSAQDLYNGTTAYPVIDLGTVSLAAGTRAFKFTATGKNASSSNYHLGIDLITLTLATGDTTPPTVSITAPPDSSTVSGTAVAVSATASDNVGVVGVQFKLNGANLGAEDTTSPYGITWNTTSVSDATHVLTATARDAAGNSTTSSGVMVTVNNARSVYYVADFETGQLQKKTDFVQDSIGVKTQLVDGPTKSISDITKADPGIVTSSNHGYVNGTAVTITGVNGMTQVNGRMFRVQNKTTHTFELWEDHPPGVANPDHSLGNNEVDTTGYGAYLSGGTLMSWEELIINNGGGGPGANADVRVMESETVDGQLVLPRKGDYFLRSALHFEKDYSIFAGNSSINKPRWNGTLPDEAKNDYDTETWFGISYFLPVGYEAETGKKGHGGQNQLLDITEDAGPSGHGFFIIDLRVPGSGTGSVPADGDEAHWIGRYHVTDNSTTVPATTTYVDFGRVGPDLGKWTDFIIRYRVNPFSVQTNASTITGGINQVYDGNKGILQVWKSTGAVDGNGDREMTLVLDLENTPVGGVPREGYPIKTSVRQYKFNWHRHPTDVEGPIWIGYDEIRTGQTVRDGIGYSDVHPSQLSMP